MMDPVPLDPQPFEAQAQVFKVLTHPARLAILEILRDGEHCVCHMEAHLGFRQAFISQHLAVMREAGLIVDRREGWNIFYRVADQRIFAVLDSVHKMTGQANAKLDRDGVACPCPHCSPPVAKDGDRLASTKIPDPQLDGSGSIAKKKGQG